MQLQTIQLTNYRNYSEAQFPLAPQTIFLGPNGSGKTNVLEAIRTLSVTKSYRVTRDNEVIKWGENYCRVELTAGNDGFEYVLTQGEFGAKKVIKQNGAPIPFSHVYGLIPTVLFSPETMHLIDGPPHERRRFLDTVLSQADCEYIETLLVYRKVIRERHFILLRLQQGLGSADELDFWDRELIRTGSYLMGKRQAFINALNAILTTLYPHFAAKESPETFVIHYKPSVLAAEYAHRLSSSRGLDIKTAATTIGPHRDELVFTLNDRDITLFASRGELRRCVIAIKLAETQYLINSGKTEPLLLLDDVFSELDETRRVSFLEAIQPYQSIVTTTDDLFVQGHKHEGSVIHKLPVDINKAKIKDQNAK